MSCVRVAPADYECTLSVDGVEVEGSVATLKALKEIVITLSPEDASYIVYYYEGQASVNEAILQLPADAHVAEGWSAVLTVKAK